MLWWTLPAANYMSAPLRGSRVSNALMFKVCSGGMRVPNRSRVNKSIDREARVYSISSCPSFVFLSVWFIYWLRIFPVEMNALRPSFELESTGLNALLLLCAAA